MNLGQIVADSGRIGIYAGLINHAGTIRADSAVDEGGRILLKATKNVTLEPTSVISAAGLGGGRIEVLAEDTVRVAGVLDASAPAGGDGGFIETSGANVKIDSGAVITTTAPHGKTGTWLIDPPDFIIGVDITGAVLSANLGVTSVVVTSDGGEGGLNGDIFVNDPVAWSANNSLTLTARRDVNVNSSITSTGGGTVALNAGWDGVSSAATPTVTPGTGTIRVNAPISVSSGFGDASVFLTAGAGIEVNNNISAAAGGSFNAATISLSAGTNISVTNATIMATGGTGEGGGPATVALNAAGSINVNNSTISAQGGTGTCCGGGAATVTLNAGNGIMLASGTVVEAHGGSASSSSMTC